MCVFSLDANDRANKWARDILQQFDSVLHNISYVVRAVHTISRCTRECFRVCVFVSFKAASSKICTLLARNVHNNAMKVNFSFWRSSVNNCGLFAINRWRKRSVSSNEQQKQRKSCHSTPQGRAFDAKPFTAYKTSFAFHRVYVLVQIYPEQKFDIIALLLRDSCWLLYSAHQRNIP